MNKKDGKGSLLQSIITTADKPSELMPTVLSLDTAGNIVVDGFTKFLDSDNSKISFETKGKYIAIYGTGLHVVSCRKSNIEISGMVNKIEMFEVK